MKHDLPALDSLKVFESAARQLSFSAAARELCITRGAVSYHIRKLEEEIDCALFRRAVRQVYLTEAGQQLLPKVRGVFDELADSIAKIRPTGSNRHVSVAATTYVALRWLSPRIAAFNERQPGVSIVLQHAVNSTDFRLEDVDVAIRWDSLSDAGSRGVHRQLPMPLYPVCSPQLLHRFGLASTASALDVTALSVGALAQSPLLCEDRTLDLWQTWYGEPGPSLDNPRRTIADANVRTQAAIDAQGWTLADGMMARELETGLLVAPFAHRLEGYGYVIQSAPGRFLSHHAQALRDWLVTGV